MKRARHRAGTITVGIGKSISLKCERCVNWISQKKKQYPAAAVGVVAAVIGGLIKATVLTETFPKPYDGYANVALFLAVLLIVYDIARGGLYD